MRAVPTLLLFGLMVGCGSGRQDAVDASSAPDRVEPEVSTAWVDEDAVRLCEGNEPCFSAIGQALDHPMMARTILVFPGVYQEYVLVERALELRAVSTNPEDTEIFVYVDPEVPRPVVGVGPNALRIQASGVVVEGFTLRSNNDVVVIERGEMTDATTYSPCLFSVEDITISGNIIEAMEPILDIKSPGIFACTARNLRVVDNTILRARGWLGDAIFLGLHMDSWYFTVNDSEIARNYVGVAPAHGIQVVGSGNAITHNVIAYAGGDGIHLAGPDTTDNTVTHNEVCSVGREIVGVSPEVPVLSNVIEDNGPGPSCE